MERYPRLIICRISGYGQTGPLRLRAGHDNNYLSRTGVLGDMESPTLLPIQFADVAGGSWPAAYQIAAALFQRTHTGRGSYIDVSMADCAYGMTLMTHAEYQLTKKPGSSGRNTLTGAYPCYRIYQCKDGYVSCGSLEPQFWKKFCKGIGAPHLIRKQFSKEAIGEVQEIMMTKTMAEWDAIFLPLDACVEIVKYAENVEDDPQIKHRDLTVTIENDKNKSMNVLKAPLNMTPGMQISTERGPALGRHNRSLL